MSIYSNRLFDGGIRLRAIAFTMLVALAATLIGSAVEADNSGLPRPCAQIAVAVTEVAAVD
ncbi:MAG: hypothetical protein RIM72_18700 [Alphaproteobacteria bacterium]